MRYFRRFRDGMVFLIPFVIVGFICYGSTIQAEQPGPVSDHMTTCPTCAGLDGNPSKCPDASLIQWSVWRTNTGQ